MMPMILEDCLRLYEKREGTLWEKKAAADTPTLEDFVPHFQNLFANESSSTPDHERYLPTQHTVKEELGQPFTKNELLTALMRTKSKSAPGEDDIAAEFYKYGGEKVQDELLDICNGVLMSGQVPQIWKDSLFSRKVIRE